MRYERSYLQTGRFSQIKGRNIYGARNVCGVFMVDKDPEVSTYGNYSNNYCPRILLKFEKLAGGGEAMANFIAENAQKGSPSLEKMAGGGK